MVAFNISHKGINCVIKNVYFFNSRKKLLSARKLEVIEIEVFENGYAKIYENNQLIRQRRRNNNLYEIIFEIVTTENRFECMSTFRNRNNEFSMWHKRLGHLHLIVSKN